MPLRGKHVGFIVERMTLDSPDRVSDRAMVAGRFNARFGGHAVQCVA
jgi:hypothetical protein